MIKLSGIGPRNQEWDRLNSITPRLAVKDHTIWPTSTEAKTRLDWVDLPESSRDLLPTLDGLAAWSREIGHSNFILCGMGGSSLAPEVIAAHFNKKLTVLDSTDPEQVKDALNVDLSRSCVIIASKSGGTIETAAQKAIFQERIKKAGLDPRNHLVIITDPDSPLHKVALNEGLKVITANPNVGGRFSALSAFGLTPAALLGIDVSLLLDDAFDASRTFISPDSPVVALAALLAGNEFRFPNFYDRESLFPGLADWIEQLIAESTGKDGKGILPVVLSAPPGKRSNLITFDGSSAISIEGPLGAQFIFWEWVTALICYQLGVDPFDQPNVAESKERTKKILENWNDYSYEPAFKGEALDIFAINRFTSISDYLNSAGSGEYLGIMAYLNRSVDFDLVELRELLSTKLGIPTTFGWGPRFLHSTGQFHKGGPHTGSFIQITAESAEEIEIPGMGFDFERLILAQALGDNEALSSRGLPIIRIHLRERARGIAELLEAARTL